MVAPNVESIRKNLGILHDDKSWEQIREKAEKIFEAYGGHLRCGTKSKGWTSLDEDDRASACAEVVPFDVDC